MEEELEELRRSKEDRLRQVQLASHQRTQEEEGRRESSAASAERTQTALQQAQERNQKQIHLRFTHSIARSCAQKKKKCWARYVQQSLHEKVELRRKQVLNSLALIV